MAIRRTYRVEATRDEKTEILVSGVEWSAAYRVCRSATVRRDGRFLWESVRLLADDESHERP
jgi:hypothetical protein